ncbi:MAG: flavodoxin family protein [Clostridia bacterium]|nr:flavodoxin family protein [Clostridia bacterium]
MWMVVYVTQSKEAAEKIRTLLQEAGLPVKIRSVNQSGNDQFGCYEVLVPEAELSEAHNLIIDKVL